MQTFDYIHAPSYAHDPSSVISNVYGTRDSLLERFVTWDSAHKYIVWPNIEAYRAHFAAAEEADRVYNEVIFGFMPQKLKFDLDIDEAKHAEVAAAFPGGLADVLENIIDKIIVAFFVEFGKELAPENIIKCESIDPLGKKWSYHLIVDGWFAPESATARDFTRRVVTFLDPISRSTLDLGINKSIQNFRLVGCHKAGDERIRIKRVISGHPDECAFITDVDGCEPLPTARLIPADVARAGLMGFMDGQPQQTPADGRPVMTVTNEQVQQVLVLLEQRGLLAIHSYRATGQITNRLQFNRMRPSHCQFCRHEHTRDHTLIVRLVPVGAVIEVYESCRRDETKTILIGTINSEMMAKAEPSVKAQENAPVLAWKEHQIVKAIGTAMTGPATPLQSLFDQLPDTQRHVYSELALRPFEICDTLCIQAMMKMGKTKALKDYINQHFESEIAPPVIRFISFRQAFSGNIKEKFPDFILYSDVKGPLTQDRLIVQVESLYRLQIDETTEVPDLVVLDECESIIEQFDSGLLKNFNGSFATFQWLLRNAKHVVCMDAFISDRSYRVLARMRTQVVDNQTVPRPITFHKNEHRNGCDDTYTLTSDKLKWLGLLYSAIASDQKCVVPMSSLDEGRVLYRNLCSKFPAKRFKLYSSETPPSEKREHFNKVNVYWVDFDCVIYTPTITAGVSFEEAHFDKLFGYFIDRSCPVETCIQMIGRVRNIREKQYFICLDSIGGRLPVEIEDIKRALYTDRENLFRGFDAQLMFEYGPLGEIKYYHNDYFHLWLENRRMRNLSQNFFVPRFVQLVRAIGAKFEHLSDDEYETHTGIRPVIDGELSNELADIRSQHRTAKADIAAEHTRRITRAPDISDEEAVDTRARLRAQLDVDDATRDAYERWRLRRTYKYAGPINDDFVAKFYGPRTREVYHNLRAIISAPADIALTRIQEHERVNYSYAMEDFSEYADVDVGRRYSFGRHQKALRLLKLCGYGHVWETNYVHVNVLHVRFSEAEKEFRAELDDICREFEMSRPPNRAFASADAAQYVGAFLKVINRVLGAMYGARIGVVDKGSGVYQLQHHSAMTILPPEAGDEGGSIRLKYIGDQPAVPAPNAVVPQAE